MSAWLGRSLNDRSKFLYPHEMGENVKFSKNIFTPSGGGVAQGSGGQKARKIFSSRQSKPRSYTALANSSVSKKASVI